MRDAGVWDRACVIETVRLTPWGTRQRPYLFRDSLRSPCPTLAAPRDDQVCAGRQLADRGVSHLRETADPVADYVRSGPTRSNPTAGSRCRAPGISLCCRPHRRGPPCFIDEIAPMPRLYPYAHW